MGRIAEAPVIAIHLPREDGAHLVGVAADGDDGRDGDLQELGEVLGTVRRGVEADLLEDFERHRMHVTSRLGTGAGDVGQVADGPAEDRFGEMAAARITGAQDEDEGLAHRWGKSAATGARLAGLRHAHIRGEAVGMLGAEEEDPFLAFDDAAEHREDREEGEVVLDLERQGRRTDQLGAATEDLQGLRATDAVLGVIGGPELQAGGDLGPDRAAAIDETLLHAGHFGEVQVDRRQPSGRQAETEAERRVRGQRLTERFQ